MKKRKVKRTTPLKEPKLGPMMGRGLGTRVVPNHLLAILEAIYKASEKSKAGSCILTFVYVVAAAFIICSILMMAGSMTIGTIAFFNGGKL